MSAITLEEAHAILSSRDLIAIGARADDERRRRRGSQTTFVRVFDIHVDAVPAVLPQAIRAGEVRLTGRPSSLEAATAAVRQAHRLAGRIPVTAFSLADLWDLADRSIAGFRGVLAGLKGSGLDAIAEAPIDLLPDSMEIVEAVRHADLALPRLTINQLTAESRLAVVERARQIQAAVGGVHAFAPLPRTSSIAQPSTGYDDVKQVAIARLVVDNIDSIQVDWGLYGPKLAQVALTMGADDVDGVSPFEGDLGPRRSPLEEIRGNIRAAGLQPVERDATFTLA